MHQHSSVSDFAPINCGGWTLKQASGKHRIQYELQAGSPGKNRNVVELSLRQMIVMAVLSLGHRWTKELAPNLYIAEFAELDYSKLFRREPWPEQLMRRIGEAVKRKAAAILIELSRTELPLGCALKSEKGIVCDRFRLDWYSRKLRLADSAEAAKHQGISMPWVIHARLCAAFLGDDLANDRNEESNERERNEIGERVFVPGLQFLAFPELLAAASEAVHVSDSSAGASPARPQGGGIGASVVPTPNEAHGDGTDPPPRSAAFNQPPAAAVEKRTVRWADLSLLQQTAAAAQLLSDLLQSPSNGSAVFDPATLELLVSGAKFALLRAQAALGPTEQPPPLASMLTLAEELSRVEEERRQVASASEALAAARAQLEQERAVLEEQRQALDAQIAQQADRTRRLAEFCAEGATALELLEDLGARLKAFTSQPSA